MTAPSARACDRLHVGLVRRVGWWGVALFVGATLGLLPLDRHLALGVAVGGAITLALFAVYRALAPAMLGAPARRRSRVLFWVVWCAKWPLIAVVLYLSFRHGAAAPVGVALGVGVLPAVATALALRALLADAWQNMHPRVQS